MASELNDQALNLTLTEKAIQQVKALLARNNHQDHGSTGVGGGRGLFRLLL